jgi:DNA-binding NarL/FixJ family response regulator
MGSAARARGLLEAERGHIDAASEVFAAAVSHHRAVGMPFEEALAHLAAGEALRRAGARRNAVEHLKAASAAFVAVRALPFVDVCERELRGCGSRPAHHARGELPRLTPQERSVATLVATGMSNRDVAAELMLSVKTIEYHLANAFGKLGVRSRTELAHRLRSTEAGADEPAVSR